MKEKSETRTCDYCKKSYDSEFVVPYIIFVGDSTAPVDIYSKPMSFKICMECMGNLSLIEIVEKLGKE